MASLSSPSRRQQQFPALSRSALRARDALVLEHLPLADAIASAAVFDDNEVDRSATSSLTG
jgi:hypothetical protein